jgi:hypothetical protein
MASRLHRTISTRFFCELEEGKEDHGAYRCYPTSQPTPSKLQSDHGRQMTAGTWSTREKAKCASARPRHGIIHRIGRAATLSQITKVARGVVDNISVIASAMRRKFRLAIRDLQLFYVGYSLNCHRRSKHAWNVMAMRMIQFCVFFESSTLAHTAIDCQD